MSMGVRIRYIEVHEDQFTVEAFLPADENQDTWQRVGVVTQIEYDDAQKGWEFEALSGRTNEARDRKMATARGMILMGYATRSGDVIEDIPREERDRGRRPNAQ